MKGSAASGQLKPSFDWVGATAAATHLSVTGTGAGDCIGTREQTCEDIKSHASSPVRSRTAVSEAWSTSNMPEPELEEKYIRSPYRYAAPNPAIVRLLLADPV